MDCTAFGNRNVYQNFNHYVVDGETNWPFTEIQNWLIRLMRPLDRYARLKNTHELKTD